MLPAVGAVVEEVGAVLVDDALVVEVALEVVAVLEVDDEVVVLGFVVLDVVWAAAGVAPTKTISPKTSATA